MRRELIILLVFCSMFLAIGCADTGTEEPVTSVEEATPVDEVTPQNGGGGNVVDVSIKDFSFNPESVTISTGDTVRWTNMDSTSHTVRGPAFESDSLAKGDSFEFLFTEPGFYEYDCSIHPSMKGTVTVEEK